MIRWIACVFGIVAATIHASAVISLQWLGWLICLVSISLWLFIALKDKDKARATMQFYFLIISIIAVYNWLKYI
jgi:hypothetical protein